MSEQDVERLSDEERLGLRQTAEQAYPPLNSIIYGDVRLLEIHVERILAAHVAAARADERERLAGEVRALIDLADRANTAVGFDGSRMLTMVPADALRALVAPSGHDTAGETT